MTACNKSMLRMQVEVAIEEIESIAAYPDIAQRLAALREIRKELETHIAAVWQLVAEKPS